MINQTELNFLTSADLVQTNFGFVDIRKYLKCS